MGDTVTVEVNENWQEFFSTTDATFTFSNGGPNEVYVRESTTEPSGPEKGYIFMTSEGGAGKVESSPFWVRAKSGNSTFHHGVVIP